MNHIALLRGVNVGGNKLVAMADLRAFLAELKLGAGQTLLQSGNLVFRSERRIGAKLERWLESEAERRLGLRTTFHVRTAEEWKAIIAENPFSAEAKSDPSHLLVMFFSAGLDPKKVTALQASIVGPEKVRAAGRQAYFSYPSGIGGSRLTPVLIEKHLGPGGTARNWNTILKLDALVQLR